LNVRYDLHHWFLFVQVSLRRAKWADIDLEASEWSYLVSKTNTEHIVPLSIQAIKILRDITHYRDIGSLFFKEGMTLKSQ
jgi:integrase